MEYDTLCGDGPLRQRRRLVFRRLEVLEQLYGLLFTVCGFGLRVWRARGVRKVM